MHVKQETPVHIPVQAKKKNKLNVIGQTGNLTPVLFVRDSDATTES